MDPYISERSQIVRDLYRHGCWPQYATVDACLDLLDEPTFKFGVTLFRNATGLPGDANDVAEGNPILFCALPAVAFARGNVCKWPHKDITFTTVGALGSITADQFRDCAVLTMGWWAEVCGIRPAWTADADRANIVMYAKRLDGPQGVLAQMQLPCGASSTSRMQGQFDLERLVIAENPPSGTLDLARIMCHELGHALGSDHLQAGALLAPTYSQSVRKPTAIDAAEMQKRYGPPVSQPAPPPIPAPSDDVVTIRFRGKLLSINGVNIP